MTLIEIVNKLEEMGHAVSYRLRSDGGLLITSIDGHKYSGAEGNTMARSIVGATLSEARRIQLSEIKPIKGKKRTKLAEVKKELKNLLHRVQYMWKKNKLREKGRGRITLKKVRWNLYHLGAEEAKRKLMEALRYASGLAYNANIDSLIGYIYNYANKVGTKAKNLLLDLAGKIDANRDKIKEEMISKIYDSLYDLDHGISPARVVSDIESIIGI